ncbi:hypothetical protein CBL_01340 [Carabus blaptoides fortunei]
MITNKKERERSCISLPSAHFTQSRTSLGVFYAERNTHFVSEQDIFARWYITSGATKDALRLLSTSGSSFMLLVEDLRGAPIESCAKIRQLDPGSRVVHICGTLCRVDLRLGAWVCDPRLGDYYSYFMRRQTGSRLWSECTALSPLSYVSNTTSITNFEHISRDYT